MDKYIVLLHWVLTEGNEGYVVDRGIEDSWIYATSQADAARRLVRDYRNQEYINDVTCVESGSVTYAGGSRVVVVNTLYYTQAEDNLIMHTFEADIELEADWEARIEAEAQAG
ncbi:hypothetical protein UFOVP210_30 [uncultured Caudovirales phage]|uniref:Uncharacterized protein n=1 Tax=uncultured Caudovirales phage TaxID=2100421 RepID=A0A6J7WJP4_9CAUD|nr:hypothetical protein UFOVP210_30 [uncultured Caudovirales phage]